VNANFSTRIRNEFTSDVASRSAPDLGATVWYFQPSDESRTDPRKADVRRSRLLLNEDQVTAGLIYQIGVHLFGTRTR
jgi:hypothetical protein